MLYICLDDEFLFQDEKRGTWGDECAPHFAPKQALDSDTLTMSSIYIHLFLFLSYRFCSPNSIAYSSYHKRRRGEVRQVKEPKLYPSIHKYITLNRLPILQSLHLDSVLYKFFI